MKKALLVAAALLAASSATAAFDFANPDSIAKIMTAAQLQTLTSDVLYQCRGVGADENGSFLVINQNASALAGLYRVNPTGLTGSEVVSAGLLNTAMGTGVPGYPMNAIRTHSDGTIYLSGFNGTDDIIRVTTGPAAAANVFEGDGTAGMDLSSDGTLVYLSRSTGLGAAASEVASVPAGGTGGALTTVAGLTAITTASGGAGFGAGPLAVLSNGNIVVWDETAFGGSDQMLQVTPAGAVTVFFNPTVEAGLGSSSGGYTSMAADGNGNLFLFDEFNGTGALSDSLVIRDSVGAFTRLDAATINAGIGVGTFEFKTMDAYSTATEIRLFAADDETDGIVMVVWTDPGSSVENWNQY